MGGVRAANGFPPIVRAKHAVPPSTLSIIDGGME